MRKATRSPYTITKHNSSSEAKQLGLLIRLAVARFAHHALQITFAIASKGVRGLARFIVLPIYRMTTIARLKLSRIGVPAKSLAFSFITGRYLFHVAVATIAVATVISNLMGTQVNAQDSGQSSILYGIVVESDQRTTEQNANPELVIQDSKYASQVALIANPDIDFDYQADELNAPFTSPSIPGALLANNLQADEPNQPAGPAKNRTETETYTVKEGDTLSVIAQQYGVTVGTILWANNKTTGQYIRPGDSLKIPPVSGILLTVKSGDTVSSLAKKYGIEASEIIRVNQLDDQKTLAIGSEIVLPGASPLPTYVAKAPTTSIQKNGLPSSSLVYQGKPQDANPESSPMSKLLWPTSGYVITQYYGWSHVGLDIDGDYDSPLYASHDGVVTTSGWNSGGYGLQIVIQGDGVMTRYAHASKLFVKVGDKVKRGQTIAMMGTTGRSTGTHLHYEVYINGKRVNPLTYLR